MVTWVRKWFKKCYDNRVLRYIFFGGLTTLVNLATYALLRIPLSSHLVIANTLSVCTAILFAYVVNSRFVFETQAVTFQEHFSEFIKFIGARLSTMVIEVGGVWLMVQVMGLNDMVAKFVIQFVILVLNYLFSRFLVFRKKKEA